jgi:eukaryotic-like serine/threonine-protein kinase
MKIESPADPTLTAVVAVFEERLVDGEYADWRSYLPSASHEDFKRWALEMILVDIHHRWKRGEPKRLPDYLAELPPECREDVAFRQAVAHEEWRCRRNAGEEVELKSVFESYALPTDMPDSGRSEQRQAMSKRLAEELDAILARSSEPFGFRVVESIGSGELSRVFLAEQLRVGARRIVLKIGVGPAQEIDALARLHHENIVPLYWAESEPPYYLLCMPYFGQATLHTLLRTLDEKRRKKGAEVFWERLGGRVGFQPTSRTKLSFEDGALWLGGRIARGLAHAHDHDVIHGDVKPANILLATNGEPMLLDFNIASLGAAVPNGGTPPYMSPEQVRRQLGEPVAVGVQSDLFSLGIVLYELAVGRRPYPDRFAFVKQSLERMLEDRRRKPSWKQTSFSPAFRSIVETCLAFDPENRYRSCDEFITDVERHLEDLPLRRAPNSSLLELGRKQSGRAVSWLSKPRQLKVFVLASILAAAGSVVAVRQYLASTSAVERAALSNELDQLRIRFATNGGRVDRTVAGLRKIESLEGARRFDAGWTERDKLFWLGASAAERQALANSAMQVERFAAKALAPFRADVDAAAKRLRLKADDVDVVKRMLDRFPVGVAVEKSLEDLPTASRQLIEVVQLLEAGEPDKAKSLLDELALRNRNDFWISFWIFQCDAARGQNERAVGDLTTCLALRPDLHDLVLLKARAHLKTETPHLAANEAALLIEVEHELGEAHLVKGFTNLLRKEWLTASADFDRAVSHGVDGPSIRLLMNAAAKGAGNSVRADEELKKALTVPPRSADDWMAVAWMRLTSNPVDWDAVDDAVSGALELDPNDPHALSIKATILLRKRSKPSAALRMLEPLIANKRISSVGRAVHVEALVHLNRIEDAIKASAEAFDNDQSPAHWFRLAKLMSTAISHAADDQLKDQVGVIAVRTLSFLVANNLITAAQLRVPEFNPLRNRNDFQLLVGKADLLPQDRPAAAPGDAGDLADELRRRLMHAK